MDFLGIGPLEFFLIVVITVIVLGPKGMVEAAREAGKFIRKIVRSPIWQDVVDTSREIQEFPRKIAREAGIEKDLNELRRSTQGTLGEIERSHMPRIQPVFDEAKAESEKEPKGESSEGEDAKE